MTATGAEARSDPDTYEWKGRTGPFSILINPGVFSPTYTSRTLADAIDFRPGDTVVDVGCGSGVLSFVAARLGAARVIGCDLSEAAVEAARENARRLDLADRTEFRVGDLLFPVRDVKADLIIGDVSGIPDDIAQMTGWFPDGRAGGPTGAEVPSMMLESLEETDCLAPGGRMYLPTGTLQNEKPILELARRIFGEANMHKVLQKDFPLPDTVAKSKDVARMAAQGLLSLRQRGSRLLWSLSIWRCVRGTAGGRSLVSIGGA